MKHNLFPQQKAGTVSALCLFCGKYFKKKQNRQKYCGSRNEKGSCVYIARRLHLYKNRRLRNQRQRAKSKTNTKNIERISYIKKAVRIRDNNTCQKCGLKNENPSFFDMDHKDSNNKHNSLDNLWLLCPNCHRLKTIEDRKRLSGSWLKWKLGFNTSIILYEPKPIVPYKAMQEAGEWPRL